jgi:hypothetical protein
LAGMYAHAHHTHHIDERGESRKYINPQLVHVANVGTMNEMCKFLLVGANCIRPGCMIYDV